jgi:hypothetical protein
MPSDTSALQIMVGIVKDGMSIGATKSEGVDANSTEALRGPWGQFTWYGEVPLIQQDSGIDLVQPHLRGDDALLENVQSLGQAGQATCAFEVTNIGFDGANVKRVSGFAGLTGFANRSTQSTRLDGISGGGSGTVSFEIPSVSKIETTITVDSPNEGGLSFCRRECNPGGISVLVSSSIPNNSSDDIVVSKSGCKRL